VNLRGLRGSGLKNHQNFFKSGDQAYDQTQIIFDGRKQFPIFDPAEEAVLKE
jgi:hypothetical protein